MIRVHWENVDVVVYILNVAMSNYAHNIDKHLYEIIGFFVLMREMKRCDLGVIHFIMEDG